MRKEFCYVYSSELDIPVKIKVGSLFGYLDNYVIDRYQPPSGHMFLKIAIYCNNRQVGCDVQTSFQSHDSPNANREIQRWDEWCTLPIKYCELSRDAFVHITLWDVGETIEPLFVAQCVKTLFSKHGIFRSGQLDLRLEKPESGKPEVFGAPTLELSEHTKIARNNNRHDIYQLLKKEKMYNANLVDKVPWLDQITFSRLEEIKERAKTEDRSLYLVLSFPSVHHNEDTSPYSIIYYVDDDDILLGTIRSIGGVSSHAATRVDPELGLENLCEIKHHMLTRNARAGDIDRRLKPNSGARDALETIIRAPTLYDMTTEQKDLIWKFRFWLKSEPQALTKFVRSVNWDEDAESAQAMQLIREWDPISACDALELLSPNFTHPFVRRYAVSRLSYTSHQNILTYLPQLVQALRYEPRALDEGTLDSSKRVSTTLSNDLSPTSVKSFGAHVDEKTTSKIEEYFGPESDLASFLVRAAVENNGIANFLYWYLKVEIQANAELDEPMSVMYAKVLDKLNMALSQATNSARRTYQMLISQKKFVENLVDMAKLVAEVSGNRMKKLDVLKKKLSESADLVDLKGLSLPLDPSIHVKSIIPEQTHLFSSNLMPMKLTFSTVRGSAVPYECGEAYTTIFKRGDDLRQDQLVIQMIRLMDSLLKEEKLDLCLTPYAVLATSVNEGFVQFVRATPVAHVKSIQESLRNYRPSYSGPYGIEADALNNYTRSIAGYSIICYILGIGDRHLDNLLLCENGKIFHVDFGFILGRDPKPMPPPMKLTNDMINAMGGQTSEHYKKFLDYCTNAFLILRRSARLITNLFALMLDAGIPDIAIEKDKAVQKVLDRFHLDLSDEDAVHLILAIIEKSIGSTMGYIVDLVHEAKQIIS